MRRLIVLVIVVAAIFGAWYFMGRKFIAVPSPKQILTAAPVPINQTTTIASGHEFDWTFSAPAGKTPGVFQGHWTCSGKTAAIKGATDDTLIAFRILDPNNKIIQHDDDHPMGGNFKIDCDDSGSYTLVFDNSGIIRSSARNVVINATYQPD